MSSLSSSEPSQQTLRRFALSLSGTLVVIFGLALPYWHHAPSSLWPWITGICVLMLYALCPAVLKRIYSKWMTMAQILLRIQTYCILGGMYGGLIVPTGILIKCIGYDPLNRRWDPKLSSYRDPIDPKDSSSFRRPF